MAKPLYVQAFEHFKDSNGNDPLKAYVAFGMYIEAECKWATSQATWPNNARYKEWFDCSFPHTTDTHVEKATDVLQAFANNIVDQEREEFLEAALKEYKDEAAKAEKGFWRRVSEGVTAAFIWSILLIVFSIIIQRIGIDLIEVYQKAAGLHH
jgi:hypothetical protein